MMMKTYIARLVIIVLVVIISCGSLSGAAVGL